MVPVLEVQPVVNKPTSLHEQLVHAKSPSRYQLSKAGDALVAGSR